MKYKFEKEVEEVKEGEKINKRIKLSDLVTVKQATKEVVDDLEDLMKKFGEYSKNRKAKRK